MSENLKRAVAQWINTFPDLTRECHFFEDLSDGVLLYEILAQISPVYFGDLDEISPECPDLHSKIANLEVLARGIEQYYISELHQIEFSSGVNLEHVAEGDEGALLALVEQAMGAVVQCADKDVYIQAILGLPFEDQQELMHLIQKVMTAASVEGPSGDSEDTLDVSPLTYEVEVQLADARRQFEEERHQLAARADELQALSESRAERIARLEADLAQAQQQAEDSDERLSELRRDTSAQLQVLQQAVDTRDAQAESMKTQVEDAARLESEHRAMRDELDALQARAAQAAKHEELIEKLRERLEEVGPLKQLIASLREENTRHIEKALDLEEQLEHVPALRAQLEALKEQRTTTDATKEDLHKEHCRLRAEHELLTEQHGTLEGEAAHLRGKVAELQERLVEASVAAPSGNVGATSLADEMRDDLGSSRQAIAEKRRLRNELEAERCTVAELRAELDALKAEGTRVPGSPEGPEATETHARAEELRAKLTAQAGKLEKARRAHDRAEQELQTMRKQFAPLVTKVREYEAELAQARETIVQQAAKIEGTSGLLTGDEQRELIDAKARFQKQNQDLMAQLDAKEAETRKLLGELMSYAVLAKRLEEDKQKLVHELARCKEEQQNSDRITTVLKESRADALQRSERHGKLLSTAFYGMVREMYLTQGRLHLPRAAPPSYHYLAAHGPAAQSTGASAPRLAYHRVRNYPARYAQAPASSWLSVERAVRLGFPER
eukprot:gnl/Trimastix_PCT/2903.p1 GENE.gnl/Trimastix_PCT/2903~~gnl/Trimastix_PCT/2903.p1  ORF type:complete len:730 (+),score=281.24 gnl/Trimastix_PCT/2903:47-2236(+)